MATLPAPIPSTNQSAAEVAIVLQICSCSLSGVSRSKQLQLPTTNHHCHEPLIAGYELRTNDPQLMIANSPPTALRYVRVGIEHLRAIQQLDAHEGGEAFCDQPIVPVSYTLQ